MSACHLQTTVTGPFHQPHLQAADGHAEGSEPRPFRPEERGDVVGGQSIHGTRLAQQLRTRSQPDDVDPMAITPSGISRRAIRTLPASMEFGGTLASRNP